ncbi:hypothetical protein Uis1B_2109 [Bifidobacterium margollesii]|uniref:PhnA protein n=1 Tax=Bifidobacterium margollesii TaxID=2020964 RepID=A0A2N5J769_9BIFI|nr:hypothetical protein [Bifidobacterium margollesii]PLS30058.1 hypothetical protein Uis1B_2109 [Bifidobacterium margollesii]
MSQCQYCGETETREPWTLCQACRARYAKGLDRLRRILPLLDQITRREYRLAERAGRAAKADAPTPLDLHAQDLIDETENMLQDVCVTAGFTWLDRWPRLIRRMIVRLDLLCRSADAGRSLHRVEHAVERLTPVVDRRPRTRRIIGPCPACGTEITAASGESLRRCPECGSIVDADALRSQTAETADRYHLTRTPAGLSEWLREEYGYRISRKQVSNWVNRGKLPSTTPVGDGYYEFSIREVLAMAMASRR